MSRRGIRAAATAVALVATAAAPAWGWGGRMHEIINRRAVELLDGPAGDAWGPFARTLGAHALDADIRKSYEPDEPPRHYIDIDAWGRPPFDRVPRSLETMIRRNGLEPTLRFGIAPWAVEECYRMVVLSLRRGDWASAGAWAADLGHYVADTHQPLHCTVNFDGQRSGNDGVHLRFEVKMMNRFFREESIAPALAAAGPGPAGKPVDRCFAWIAEAYPGVEAILRADSLAREEDPDFGDGYYRALWAGTEETATLQMARAVRDLAALYRAAWEEAGEPAAPEAVPALRPLPVAELEGAAPAGRKTARGALLVAGAAIVGVLALGAR